MKRLVISSLAAGDLGAIARYTEEVWGAAQKRHYLGLIESALRRLRAGPAVGRKRDDLKPGYRSVVVGRHVVIYRVGADAVEILRIFHGGMDVAEHLADDPDAGEEGGDS